MLWPMLEKLINETFLLQLGGTIIPELHVGVPKIDAVDIFISHVSSMVIMRFVERIFKVFNLLIELLKSIDIIILNSTKTLIPELPDTLIAIPIEHCSVAFTSTTENSNKLGYLGNVLEIPSGEIDPLDLFQTWSFFFDERPWAAFDRHIELAKLHKNRSIAIAILLSILEWNFMISHCLFSFC